MTLKYITLLAGDLCERDLNKHLVEQLMTGKLSETVFLEYLAVTQSDVLDNLERATEEDGEPPYDVPAPGIPR